MVDEVHGDSWYGCYAQSLRTLLVPAVPAHPAKMAGGWRYASSRMFRRRGGCRLGASSLIPWQGGGDRAGL
jgi:hypothetical protein